MNTHHDDTHEHDHHDHAEGTPEGRTPKAGRGRTQRAAFWLQAIDARKHKLTREYRKSLRDVAREGVSDEEYAAMLATLEKMARNLGWDESQLDERPFGRGHRRGFGPGRGFGPAPEWRGLRHPAMLRGHGRMHPRHHDHDGHVTPAAPQA